MPIIKVSEYVISCDVDQCCESHAAYWRTRDQVEKEVTIDGWVKFAPGKWMCPNCKKRLKQLSAARSGGEA